MHAARAAGLRRRDLSARTFSAAHRRCARRSPDRSVQWRCGSGTRKFRRAARHGRSANRGRYRVSEAVSDIDVLLRLENNLKLRAMQAATGMRALDLPKRMVLLAPRRPELWARSGAAERTAGALGAARKPSNPASRSSPPASRCTTRPRWGCTRSSAGSTRAVLDRDDAISSPWLGSAQPSCWIPAYAGTSEH